VFRKQTNSSRFARQLGLAGCQCECSSLQCLCCVIVLRRYVFKWHSELKDLSDRGYIWAWLHHEQLQVLHFLEKATDDVVLRSQCTGQIACCFDVQIPLLHILHQLFHLSFQSCSVKAVWRSREARSPEMAPLVNCRRVSSRLAVTFKPELSNLSFSSATIESKAS